MMIERAPPFVDLVHDPHTDVDGALLSRLNTNEILRWALLD